MRQAICEDVPSFAAIPRLYSVLQTAREERMIEATKAAAFARGARSVPPPSASLIQVFPAPARAGPRLNPIPKGGAGDASSRERL